MDPPAATAVLFVLTEVPSLEAERRLLKGAVLVGLAVLAAMTQILKRRRSRD